MSEQFLKDMVNGDESQIFMSRNHYIPTTNLKKIDTVSLSKLALETVALVQCWD